MATREPSSPAALAVWDTIDSHRKSTSTLTDDAARLPSQQESRGGTNRGADNWSDAADVRKAEDDALDQLLSLQLSALCRALAAAIFFTAARGYLRFHCTVRLNRDPPSFAVDAAIGATLSAMLLVGLRIQRMPLKPASDPSELALPQHARYPCDASLLSHRLIFAAKAVSVAASFLALRIRANGPTCRAAPLGALGCARAAHNSIITLHSLLLMAALRPVPRRLIFTETVRQLLCAAYMAYLVVAGGGGAAAQLWAVAQVVGTSFVHVFVVMLLASVYSDPELDRLSFKSVCMHLSLGPHWLRPMLVRFLAVVGRVRGLLLLPRVSMEYDGVARLCLVTTLLDTVLNADPTTDSLCMSMRLGVFSATALGVLQKRAGGQVKLATSIRRIGIGRCERQVRLLSSALLTCASQDQIASEASSVLGGLFPSVVACSVVLFAPASDGTSHRRTSVFDERSGSATYMEVHVVSVDGCDDNLTSALESSLPDKIRIVTDSDKTARHSTAAWCIPGSAGPVENESGSSLEFVAQGRGGRDGVTSRDPRAERLLPESMYRSLDSFTDWWVVKRAWAESEERQRLDLSVASIEAVTLLLGDPSSPLGVVQVFIAPSWDGVDNIPYLLTEFCEIVSSAVRRYRLRADETCRASTEALLRMQRAFLHNISHELRTPLNSVAGFTELVISRNQLGPLDREYLTEAAGSAEEMLGLVNQLIEYASIQGLSAQERLVSERVVLVFLRMLNEVVELLAPRALRKGVELVAMVEPEVDAMRLCGDHYRVRQCILNLADNGIKYTPEGGRVVVRVRRPSSRAQSSGSRVSFSAQRHMRHIQRPGPASAARQDIEIAVEDSGMGLEPSQIARLWRPFVQVTAIDGTKHSGTGLGLAIVSAIVQQMDGSKAVTSVPGVRTEFTIVLPLHPSAPPEEGLEPGRSAIGIRDLWLQATRSEKSLDGLTSKPPKGGSAHGGAAYRSSADAVGAPVMRSHLSHGNLAALAGGPQWLQSGAGPDRANSQGSQGPQGSQGTQAEAWRKSSTWTNLMEPVGSALRTLRESDAEVVSAAPAPGSRKRVVIAVQREPLREAVAVLLRRFSAPVFRVAVGTSGPSYASDTSTGASQAPAPAPADPRALAPAPAAPPAPIQPVPPLPTPLPTPLPSSPLPSSPLPSSPTPSAVPEVREKRARPSRSASQVLPDEADLAAILAESGFSDTLIICEGQELGYVQQLIDNQSAAGPHQRLVPLPLCKPDDHARAQGCGSVGEVVAGSGAEPRKLLLPLRPSALVEAVGHFLTYQPPGESSQPVPMRRPHSVTGLATPPPDPGSSVSSVSGSRGDQSAASQSTTGAAPSAAVGAGGAVASAQSQVIDVAGASASEWQRIPTAPAGTVSANGLLHPAGSHAPLRNTVGGDLDPKVPPVAPATGALRVLLVEDVVTNQKLAKAVLARMDTVVDVASDGVEATQLFESNPTGWDDILMPRMNGVEATLRIREIEASLGIEWPVPIVALTAMTSAEDKAAYMHAGMCDMVAKPLRAQALQAALDAQTRRRKEEMNHLTGFRKMIRPTM